MQVIEFIQFIRAKEDMCEIYIETYMSQVVTHNTYQVHNPSKQVWMPVPHTFSDWDVTYGDVRDKTTQSH